MGDHGYPTVLRTPVIGNVHTRHDLDPTENAGLKRWRSVRHVVKDPIHPEPDPKALFGGLKMEVGSALINGPPKQLVHESNYRALALGQIHIWGDVDIRDIADAGTIA
jgi:hypothetical protein